MAHNQLLPFVRDFIKVKKNYPASLRAFDYPFPAFMHRKTVSVSLTLYINFFKFDIFPQIIMKYIVQFLFMLFARLGEKKSKNTKFI